MNIKTILPIALAGGAVLYFMSKAQAGKNIKINLSGVSFSGGTIIPNAFLKFRVINGTSTGVVLNSVVGEVFVNGKFFATVSNTDKFTIQPNSETYYSVKLSPSGLQMIGILYNLIKNRQRVNVEFNGTVNTSGALIPINQKISV